MSSSDIIALVALLVSGIGIWISCDLAKKLTKRNEDKLLLDELLSLLNQLNQLSSNFFLSDRRDRLDTHHFHALFLVDYAAANHLIQILKEKRKLFMSIDQDFSNFHRLSTENTESINSWDVEQCLQRHSQINESYLKCMKQIYDTFHQHHKP